MDFTPGQGTVALPFGALAMTAHADTLEVRIDVTDPEGEERARQVVASHLDRFAFREAPLPFDWQRQ